MRKMLIMLVTAVLAVAASAQTEGTFRMGVRINGGVSNISDFGYGAAFGYGIGWIAEYSIRPTLYLQSGIGLENIACKYDVDQCNAFYGQLPVHFGFRHALSDGKALLVQAGPTFSVGLFGSHLTQYCITGDGHGPCGPETVFDDLRRFDLELGGRVGVEIRKIRISAGANFGVTKAVPSPNDLVGSYGHTMTVNLGLAYMF